MITGIAKKRERRISASFGSAQCVDRNARIIPDTTRAERIMGAAENGKRAEKAMQADREEDKR